MNTQIHTTTTTGGNFGFVNNDFGITAASLGLSASLQPIVDQFLAMEVAGTGWTWGAALDDAFLAAAERGHSLDCERLPLHRFLRSHLEHSPGFSWGAAIEMSLESGTDVTLSDIADFIAILKDSDDGDCEDASSFSPVDFASEGEVLLDNGWTVSDVADLLREKRLHGRSNRRSRLH